MNKEKNHPVASRPSKKRKNTYIIKYSTFGDPRWFIDCPSTPLTVAEKNGEKIKSATLFEKCEKFPNPGPVVMFAQYNLFSQIMTPSERKLASTIVEYLDKETGEPIAYLYPNCDIVSEQYDTLPKLMARLNHATRQDLMRQHSKRSNMWNLIKVRGRTK